MDIDWEKYRDNSTGELDLLGAYSDLFGVASRPVVDFFQMVHDIRPVRSRQVAALALAYARSVANE